MPPEINWRFTSTREEVEAVRAKLLRSVLRMEFFRFKSSEECPEHPSVRGIAFTRAANQHLLDSFMRGRCVCDVFGCSRVLLRLLQQDGEVTEIR